MPSANFEFLRKDQSRLADLGGLAERYFREDPSTSLVKLRQFAEMTAQIVAARHGLWRDDRETFDDLLRRLRPELPPEIASIFHGLRKTGNLAVHQAKGGHGEALEGLKFARALGVWLHRVYGGAPDFKSGPFVPPPEPQDAAAPLRAEIEELRRKLEASEDAAAKARREAEEQARAKETLEEGLEREKRESAEWAKLAEETDTQRAALAAQLAEAQTQAQAAPEQVADLAKKGAEAAKSLDLDEAATRALIDQQLRDRGWEADSKALRHHLGARPAKGRDMAIAEWPTASGPADYALFAGRELVGVIEAKRQSKNVSASLDQAERYARDVRISVDFDLAEGGPWGEYRAPFVYATNGRPYLKQLEIASGIWTRDARSKTNAPRALAGGWPTPQGLRGRLQLDQAVAEAALKTMSFEEFGFPLRSYQKAAVEAVEAALAQDKRAMLVAMATGTGKTKLAIAMLYRMLAAKRFRRVCFVVDRSALGEQTKNEFSTTKVISGKTFAEIFDLKGIKDGAPDLETKTHICTIQSLVKRILYASDPAEVPPMDQYDLIVVDECHRGYLLDREMSDAELKFRDDGDYLSKYRRALEHFDAVKVGLTATPALHTTEIFGPPIFRYSYREAVAEGYLVDHEPPYRILTALSQSGIAFQKGETVEALNPKTGAVDSAETPDLLEFEVEHFNKQVITEAFNRVVAEKLAEEIDPSLPGKTLIFAATDAHADLIVQKLKEAFSARYGELEDAAVKKLTGSVDKVQEQIRAFRNDENPKIAVTVDLLTTGIDVPKIVNLVFLRLVNSRILYEQMLGRATRLCPEIQKESFRIYDAVGVYDRLAPVTDMKPVAANPKTSFRQLLEGMAAVIEEAHQAEIRAQFLVKLRRRAQKMTKAERDKYEKAAGETPEETLEILAEGGPQEAAAWMGLHGGALVELLDWAAEDGTPRLIPISQHEDHLISMEQGWGASGKPEDYLESFTAFVRENLNEVAALKLAAQHPRDLTRKDLRELRLALDEKGYSEAKLRKAWALAKNVEISASIIGFVRQAALGEPLQPYEARVKAAISRLLAANPNWTDPQRQWLRRIGDQIVKEVVVDREALDKEPFAKDGGYKRLNKIFDGELEGLLMKIGDEIWKKTA